MATVAGARARRSSERIFYTGMAAAMLLAVFIGFAPSYYLVAVPAVARPTALPITPLVHLHGLLFTAWVLLFMAQVSLVNAGRTDIHRRMGVAGAVLAVGLVVVGTLAALNGVARASGPPIVPPLSWLAVPLLAVPGYGGLIAAALWKRRSPQTHKRLMILSMVAMLGAAFGRMTWFQGLVGLVVMPSLFIVALLAWDMVSRGRPHPATLWGGAVALVSVAGPIFIWQTDAWLAFARFVSSLVA